MTCRLQGVGLACVRSLKLLLAALDVPLLRRALRRTLWGKGSFCLALRLAFPAELNRLRVLRAVRSADPHSLGFRVVLRVHKGPEGCSVHFISLPASPVLSHGDGWTAVEQALAEGNLTEVVWDHSAISSKIRFPFQGRLSIPYRLGEDGIFPFRRWSISPGRIGT